MNRYVATLLVVLGVVGLVGVLAVGSGFADERTPQGRSALRPRWRGRICSPITELKSRAIMTRGRSPWQAMMSMTATVR
jgi:hypothetical protein